MKLQFFGREVTSRLTISIIVVIISLLIISSSAYGWVSTHRSILLLTRNRPQPPATAMFVSRTAPMAISILANLDDLANLNRLAIPRSQQRKAATAIKDWKQQLGDRLHLNYQREIAPWLGEEITLAITALDFDKLPRNGSQPGYLAILSSRNVQASSSKIQAWWQQQVTAKRLTFESYQGIKLGYNRRDQLASAIVVDLNDRQYILFANHPQVLRAAINQLQTPYLSILDSPDYQQVVAANSHHKVGIGYARLADLHPWLGKAAGTKYPVAGINIGVDPQGLIADLALYPSPNQELVDPPSTPASPRLVDPLKYLPRQSTIAIAGTDLSQWRQQLTTILPAFKQLDPLLDRSLVNIDQQLNLKLDEDIFSWTTGSYALAAVPSQDQDHPDWVFIAERTQPERVDEAIADFDELASLAGYDVGLIPWQAQQVIGWTKLATETTPNMAQLVTKVAGVHTNIGNQYTILASSVAAMDQTLKTMSPRQGDDPDQHLSILDSDRYHRATNLITATETGYLYGNWQTISQLFPKQLLAQPFVQLVSDTILAGMPNLSISSSTTAGAELVTILVQVN
jgi:Protein of unknown function (DUF3352)